MLCAASTAPRRRLLWNVAAECAAFVRPVAAGEYRRFASTDGPFKRMQGTRFVEKRKNFGEVLTMANRKTLLGNAQDLLSEPHKQMARGFWFVFAERCIRSLHLFDAFEITIILRGLDVHDFHMKGSLNVYAAAVPCILGEKRIPGAAIIALADVYSRRNAGIEGDAEKLLEHLGHCVADVMWEISPTHAVTLLNTLSKAGVRDAALAARVFRKFFLQLDQPTVQPQDVATVAEAMSFQKHRDLELLQGLARRAVDFHNSDESMPECGVVAQSVLAAFDALEVDQVPEALRRLTPSTASTSL